MKKLFLILTVLFIGFAANAQCVASFTGVQNPTGNNLLNVDFNNNSSYGTVSSSQFRSYLINYGDGSSNSGYVFYSSTSLPSHAYAAPGTYTVGLTAYKYDTSTHSTVCTHSTTISIAVSYSACGTVISASSTGATQSFNAGNPAGTPGISYVWNFGDGITGTGASPVHTYAGYGTYYISCTSTAGSPASCTYYNTMNIAIAPPAAPPALNCNLTHASFTAAVGGGGSYVSCSNTSTMLAAPYLNKEKWDFGDGTISYSNGTHYYAATGIYTVQLTMEWYDSTHSVFCNKTATQTITITSVASVTIAGEVVWDSLTYTLPIYSSYKVWLIQFDPATNILSAVDSQITTLSTSLYGSTIVAVFSFTNKPTGNYLIKAAVNGGPTSGTGIVPTYCQYSATWSGATTINAVIGPRSYNIIYMLNGTVTSGPGFIGGNVALGANKGANAGVAGILVLLRNASNGIVQMTNSDENGNFSFGNIPLGSYTIYPELMNYATTAAPVTVANSNTSVIGINFHKDDIKMNIKPHLLAIGGVVTPATTWAIFPNPANSEITISWNGITDKTSGIIITDVTGKKVMQTPVYTSQQGRQKMNIVSLRPGLYIVHGTGGLNGAAQKLVVQ